MVTYPRGAIFLYRGASVTVGRCDCADNDLRGRGKRSLEDAVELNAQRRDVGDDVRVRRNVRCVSVGRRALSMLPLLRVAMASAASAVPVEVLASYPCGQLGRTVTASALLVHLAD
jgi:hypothetical protein